MGSFNCNYYLKYYCLKHCYFEITNKENYMNNFAKFWKVAATVSLLLTTSIALAETSLIELIRTGQRDAALAAIKARDVDVNAKTEDGSTALMWATYKVDHELVQALLKAGAKAKVTNRFGSTPLTEATKLGDVELVRMLLKAGADPNSPNQDNQTALMLASQIGSLEIAEMLIKKGADVNAIETFRGQTALMWAAAENHPDIAELLVKKSADVSVRAYFDDWPRQMTSEPRAQFRPTGGLTALLYAARSSCYRCAVAIVEAGADINQPNPDGITPLINALDNKSFDIAMYLIDKGANVHVWDMNGRTPIFVAVDMNSFNPRGPGLGGFFGGPSAPQDPQKHTAMELVDRLLALGVDVNHQLTRIRPNGPGRGRFADYDMRGGVGPLMIATMSDDHESMQKLIAHGAEVDLMNVFQMTPLMLASGMSGTGRGGFGGGPEGDPQARAIKTIDILLDAGANVNAQVVDSHTYTAKLDTYVQGRDQEGRTALFAAAESGRDRVVQHLIDRGADPSIKDASGKTALDIAMAPAPARAGPGPAPSTEGREKAAIILKAAMVLK